MQSLIIFKPDGVREDVMAYARECIKQSRYAIDVDVLCPPDMQRIQAHLSPLRAKYSQEIYERNVAYYASGPVRLWRVIGDAHICDALRGIVGSTEPVSADSASIRGKFSSDSYVRAEQEKRAVHNLVHTSDADRVLDELSIWGLT